MEVRRRSPCRADTAESLEFVFTGLVLQAATQTSYVGRHCHLPIAPPYSRGCGSWLLSHQLECCDGVWRAGPVGAALRRYLAPATDAGCGLALQRGRRNTSTPLKCTAMHAAFWPCNFKRETTSKCSFLTHSECQATQCKKGTKKQARYYYYYLLRERIIICMAAFSISRMDGWIWCFICRIHRLVRQTRNC